jgi:hypothetical protein
MALYYDLPVFKDVYQLILKMFDYTNHFPREYKFTLGQDLKRGRYKLGTIFQNEAFIHLIFS